MSARFAFESESLDRFGRVAPVLQLYFRARTLGHKLILPDQPIPHNNVSLRVGGDVLLVRDHDDGDAVLIELLKMAMISTLVRLSRLPVGSSASSISGSLINARAIATRCC